MKWLINQLGGIGDYLLSLSPRARLQIALVGLLVLGGSSVYKLVNSVSELGKPRPAVSAEQLILPMETLFDQTKGQVREYQTARQKNQAHLDSLAEHINPTLNPSTR